MINKDSKYTAFGGLHLIHREVISKKLISFFNEHLPKRSSNAQYHFSDLILSRIYTCFSGGSCAEDINYLETTLAPLKKFSVPSADTLHYMEKELATPSQELFSKSGTSNKINSNDSLNRLLVSTARFLKVLTCDDKDYCLDFDHQFIPTEKHDTTYSYKNKRGYFPGVASINNTPVYVENRNGNCHVNFNQKDTLERSLSMLHEHGIYPCKARMDSGSYTKEVVDFLDGEKMMFYIRAEQSDTLLFNATLQDNWKEACINQNLYQTTSIEHPFGEKTHRVVCYRWKNKTGQTRMITGDDYNYLFILTNDKQTPEEQIIRFYNKRGNSERMFDIQNNDFNWKNLPYSFLEQNTVYLIIMAIANVVYQWILKIISSITKTVNEKSRLKRFTFRVICMVAKVTRSGRRQVVKLYSNNFSP